MSNWNCMRKLDSADFSPLAVPTSKSFSKCMQSAATTMTSKNSHCLERPPPHMPVKYEQHCLPLKSFREIYAILHEFARQ